jgi:uncharacterized delta-60 repeat protein
MSRLCQLTRIFERVRRAVCAVILLAASSTSLHAQIAVTGNAGARDRDFGPFVNGGQYGAFVFAQSTITSVMAIGVQSSGKPIVAGTCNPNPTEDICLARLRVDGSQLDSTFGTNGSTQYVLSGQDYARAMQIDASDRIVIGGSCNGVAPRACVMRFNANGQLDTTFGTNGRSGVIGMIGISQLRIDNDGNLVAVGECFGSSGSSACAGRLTSNGAMDSTFNSGAVLIISFPAANFQVGSNLAFDASGRILVSAYCSATFAGNSYGRFCAARLTGAGALDPTFNAGVPRLYALSTATHNCNSSSIAAAIDGGIIVTGACTAPGSGAISRFAVSKLTASGDFDATFGTENYAGLTFQFIERDWYVQNTQVFIDDQNRVLVSAACQIGFCLTRLLPSGRPDALFGEGGAMIYMPDTAFPNTTQVSSVSTLIDSNRLLLGGYCERSATDTRGCVARHYLDTPPGERCSLDLDGDGEISAATDALLWMRVHLGIRGSALTQNAIGARAQRTSAEAISTHLATHCGIR